MIHDLNKVLGLGIILEDEIKYINAYSLREKYIYRVMQDEEYDPAL